MMKIFLYLTLSLITNSVFSQDITKNKVKKETQTRPTNDCENIEIKAFHVDQGWGFDILVNNKKYIHQTNIPAINEKKTFKTKKDAIKIARLMKSKMCKEIFPPSVSIQEIDSLILKN